MKNPQPQPSETLLLEVREFLESRRMLTSCLNVTGPRYLPVKISVELYFWPGVIDQGMTNEQDIIGSTARKIREFLHPLVGGLGGQGWQIGQSFLIADLLPIIQPDRTIGYVKSVKASPAPKAHSNPTSALCSVSAAESRGTAGFLAPLSDVWC